VTACGRCGGPDAHPYTCGYRDATCTPAALRGAPEPGRTASQYRPQTAPLPIRSRNVTVRLIAYEVTTLAGLAADPRRDLTIARAHAARLAADGHDFNGRHVTTIRLPEEPADD
jgi:hypothetical protein